MHHAFLLLGPVVPDRLIHSKHSVSSLICSSLPGMMEADRMAWLVTKVLWMSANIPPVSC